MQMNEKMDEGDIILTEQIAIDPYETSGSLFHTFEDRAGAVLIRAILGLES
jgi:methionyl-tRNA formyltransferase